MARPRLMETTWPAAVYAIGDVHGCLDELVALENAILADGAGIAGEKWLVTLGDYIDRGIDSAGVISRLLEPLPEGWRRIALLGNHEQMMLDFLLSPIERSHWLAEGGIETLLSYGIDFESGMGGSAVEVALRDAMLTRIPAEHLRLIASLPIMMLLPGWLFVHAGIRPGVPLDWQQDEDLIWIRAPFLETSRRDGLRVVHGHTPGTQPVVKPDRIDIDTYCFHSGRLTGLRVTPDGATKFFSTV